MHRILLIFILGLVSTGCFRKDLHPTFPEDLGVQSQPASVDAQKLISGVYRYHSEFVIELKADGNYLANDKIYFQSDTDTSHLGSCVFRVAGTYELRQITGKGDGVYYENGQPFAKDFSHAKYAANWL